ncbi:MAG: gliding motility-associated ABC transporter substrate-binding protein GldG [Bacteroidota bacterium]|nr:gliding motility-associated ABC transporter substrate-binding protein GldG [Bacteroidota bacterium]
MKNPLQKILASKYGWLLLLIILFGINFLASAFHSRLDLTREKRYTLSNPTKEVLNGLEDDLQIDVFLKGDFPSGFRKLANSTDEFLQLLKDRNGAKIHYEFISPQDEIPGANGVKYQDTLVAMGASPINLTVQVKAGQEQKFVFPVALVKYKGEQRLINLYSGGSRIISQVEINNAEALLEYNFLKIIDELIHPERPVVGYATGNGEPDLKGFDTYDLQQIVRQRYDFYTFNLTAQKIIPDQFNVFIIVKPSLQFTEEEKLKIDQYIMRGGHVLFFIDRLYAENDSLKFKPQTVAYDRDLNLTDILFRYGVRINPSLIMDLQCDFLSLVVGGTQENPQKEFLPWNYYPVFQSKNDHIINKNIGLVTGKFVNSLDTIQENNVRKTILLSSSPNSRIISTPALISLNENKIAPQDEKFRADNIPAAVLLEGKFTSFYKNRVGKITMDSLNKEGTPFKEESVNNAKIIVVGDGDMVLNEIIVNEGQSPMPLPMGWNRNAYQEYAEKTENARFFIPFANRNFLMNCLEYFTNKPGIIETGNKEIVLRLLNTEKVKKQKTTWQFINIALPVLLVIFFGFVYQQTRKRKYAA